MARLASAFWVRAYMARLGQAGIPSFIVARGHAQAGSVIVRVSTLNGQSELFHRSYDLTTGERLWLTMAKGPDLEIDELLTRQQARDPDLWIVEIEDPKGRNLLSEEGLRE